MMRLLIVLCTFWLLATETLAQHAEPPSALAGELCDCIGTIDVSGDERTFDLAVRHCLNTVVMKHSHEVIELWQQHPAQDRKFYMLGLLLGNALDRTCPQYPLIKERLQHLSMAPSSTPPST